MKVTGNSRSEIEEQQSTSAGEGLRWPLQVLDLFSGIGDFYLACELLK